MTIKRLLAGTFFMLVGLLATGCSAGKPELTAQLHMVDVNSGDQQGDAHILQANGEVFLIDAGQRGPAEEQLVPYLEAQGINHISRAFLSHPHFDHFEGLSVLLENNITIDDLYYNLPPDTARDCCYDEDVFLDQIDWLTAAGVQMHEVREGDLFQLGATTLEVLHAEHDPLTIVPLDVNDLSVVMRWQVGETSVLFTGGLNATMGEWLTVNKTDALGADILKVPHHGGRSLAPESFFAAVDAQLLLVPSPEWVWCGERGHQVRTWSENQATPVLVNGLHGHVTVDFLVDGTYETTQSKQDAVCQGEAAYE